jgi:hypothetical protein
MVLYLQESKFREAIRYYEPIVKKHSENILEVTAIVLANICVAYIMTSQVLCHSDLMHACSRTHTSCSKCHSCRYTVWGCLTAALVFVVLAHVPYRYL